MTSLAIQSLFTYVEEENLAAIKTHLDKFKDVDSRSDVSQSLVSECVRLSEALWNHVFCGKRGNRIICDDVKNTMEGNMQREDRA